MARERLTYERGARPPSRQSQMTGRAQSAGDPQSGRGPGGDRRRGGRRRCRRVGRARGRAAAAGRTGRWLYARLAWRVKEKGGAQRPGCGVGDDGGRRQRATRCQCSKSATDVVIQRSPSSYQLPRILLGPVSRATACALSSRRCGNLGRQRARARTVGSSWRSSSSSAWTTDSS